MALRDAAQASVSLTARSLSHSTAPADNDPAEEPLPSFLRDEYFTKQAMKQMAEHRVLLDARKNMPLPEAATTADDDDEYAWYFKNPHRYVWKPRERRSARPHSRTPLYGELRESRDAEMNRSLFASYLIRHYGAAPGADTQAGTRRGSGGAGGTACRERAGYRAQRLSPRADEPSHRARADDTQPRYAVGRADSRAAGHGLGDCGPPGESGAGSLTLRATDPCQGLRRARQAAISGA